MSSSIKKRAAAAAAGTSSKTDGRLMVDGSLFEDQFLKCPVCYERFDQFERAPKSLPCNHTFCLRCLTQIFDNAPPPAMRDPFKIDGAVKCPTCRVGVVFLSQKKIKDLPHDHRVVQMMDFLSQALVKSDTLCSKHKGQHLNFFCKKCHAPVCRGCTVVDHKESEGHVIINLSHAMSKYSTQIIEIEEQSIHMLENLSARSGPLDNALKHLNDRKIQVYGDIDKTFAQYHLLLEKRQKALKDKVCQIIGKQRAKINARLAIVSELEAQLQKLYDEFESSKNSNDLPKLFTNMQQIQKHNIEIAEAAFADDNNCFESCNFKAPREGLFLRDLEIFGEVHRKPDPLLSSEVEKKQQLLW